jgi:hypothetical protein
VFLSQNILQARSPRLGMVLLQIQKVMQVEPAPCR